MNAWGGRSEGRSKSSKEFKESKFGHLEVFSERQAEEWSAIAAQVIKGDEVENGGNMAGGERLKGQQKGINTNLDGEDGGGPHNWVYVVPRTR